MTSTTHKFHLPREGSFSGGRHDCITKGDLISSANFIPNHIPFDIEEDEDAGAWSFVVPIKGNVANHFCQMCQQHVGSLAMQLADTRAYYLSQSKSKIQTKLSVASQPSPSPSAVPLSRKDDDEDVVEELNESEILKLLEQTVSQKYGKFSNSSEIDNHDEIRCGKACKCIYCCEACRSGDVWRHEYLFACKPARVAKVQFDALVESFRHKEAFAMACVISINLVHRLHTQVQRKRISTIKAAATTAIGMSSVIISTSQELDSCIASFNRIIALFKKKFPLSDDELKVSNANNSSNNYSSSSCSSSSMHENEDSDVGALFTDDNNDESSRWISMYETSESYCIASLLVLHLFKSSLIDDTLQQQSEGYGNVPISNLSLNFVRQKISQVFSIDVWDYILKASLKYSLEFHRKSPLEAAVASAPNLSSTTVRHGCFKLFKHLIERLVGVDSSSNSSNSSNSNSNSGDSTITEHLYVDRRLALLALSLDSSSSTPESSNDNSSSDNNSNNNSNSTSSAKNIFLNPLFNPLAPFTASYLLLSCRYSALPRVCYPSAILDLNSSDDGGNNINNTAAKSCSNNSSNSSGINISRLPSLFALRHITCTGANAIDTAAVNEDGSGDVAMGSNVTSSSSRGSDSSLNTSRIYEKMITDDELQSVRSGAISIDSSASLMKECSQEHCLKCSLLATVRSCLLAIPFVKVNDSNANSNSNSNSSINSCRSSSSNYIKSVEILNRIDLVSFKTTLDSILVLQLTENEVATSKTTGISNNSGSGGGSGGSGGSSGSNYRSGVEKGKQQTGTSSGLHDKSKGGVGVGFEEEDKLTESSMFAMKLYSKALFYLYAYRLKDGREAESMCTNCCYWSIFCDILQSLAVLLLDSHTLIQVDNTDSGSSRKSNFMNSSTYGGSTTSSSSFHSNSSGISCRRSMFADKSAWVLAKRLYESAACVIPRSKISPALLDACDKLKAYDSFAVYVNRRGSSSSVISLDSGCSALASSCGETSGSSSSSSSSSSSGSSSTKRNGTSGEVVGDEDRDTGDAGGGQGRVFSIQIDVPDIAGNITDVNNIDSSSSSSRGSCVGLSDVHLTTDTSAVLSRYECKGMIGTAEAIAAKSGWSSSRHYAFPTTDIPIHTSRELLSSFNAIMRNKIAQSIASQFATQVNGDAGGNNDSCVRGLGDYGVYIFVHDAFVVKYECLGVGNEENGKSEINSNQVAINNASTYEVAAAHTRTLIDSSINSPPSPTTGPNKEAMIRSHSRRYLPLHMDQSTHSFVVALNHREACCSDKYKGSNSSKSSCSYSNKKRKIDNSSSQLKRAKVSSTSTTANATSTTANTSVLTTNDDSIFSSIDSVEVIGLSSEVVEDEDEEESSFVGGGTFFADIETSLNPSVGGMLSFSGDKLHGGDPIYAGKRYIIAAFLMLCPLDSHSYQTYLKPYETKNLNTLVESSIGTTSSNENNEGVSSESRCSFVELLGDIFSQVETFSTAKSDLDAESDGAPRSLQIPSGFTNTAASIFTKSYSSINNVVVDTSLVSSSKQTPFASANSDSTSMFSFGFF